MGSAADAGFVHLITLKILGDLDGQLLLQHSKTNMGEGYNLSYSGEDEAIV